MEDNGPSTNEMAFNPSKTFGPERGRMKIGGLDDSDGKKEGYGFGGNNDSRRNNVSGQTVLPGLERLCRQFTENHQRI